MFVAYLSNGGHFMAASPMTLQHMNVTVDQSAGVAGGVRLNSTSGPALFSTSGISAGAGTTVHELPMGFKLEAGQSIWASHVEVNLYFS